MQELRFGDNDTLSAQVAALVQADWLFLLTDVDCLYTGKSGAGGGRSALGCFKALLGEPWLSECHRGLQPLPNSKGC